MQVSVAEKKDVPALYTLQLLAFESEAQMIGSRDVPALKETLEQSENDFAHWQVLKLVSDNGAIIGSIRFRHTGGITEVGRLMVHPDYRHQGLAQMLLTQVDLACPDQVRELYTCTRSVSNIRLYEKMGYTRYLEQAGHGELTFVYMRKG